ncbi:MAG TPA: 4-hydroxybenzoate octaprenyltransferase [Burkholderiales bacterium]|jgi:4-hydroxybenzoate polyprenyltransferase|nr:4-hydroxybenzoate octaprenyltransferase [Burkholderiales bacterium]
MTRAELLDRLDAYEKLMRLDKPIGTLLLLWPTLWALWLAAGGVPHGKVLLIFVVGTLLMRSAGCAINDYADRDFDPHVARTRDRPLAAGRVKPVEALLLAAVLALIAFALVLMLNRLTILLSVVAACLAASYPFTKRFFVLPQAYLGIAFGFGIPMAYAAQLGQVPAVAWALLGANILWAIAYDTEYAMVDRDDDRKIGIRTAAILFGRCDVLAVMGFHAAFLAVLAAVGRYLDLDWPYYAGLAAAVVLIGYQYRLIRTREPARCFRAFLNNNWVGAAVFAGIALALALRHGL